MKRLYEALTCLVTLLENERVAKIRKPKILSAIAALRRVMVLREIEEAKISPSLLSRIEDVLGRYALARRQRLDITDDDPELAAAIASVVEDAKTQVQVLGVPSNLTIGEVVKASDVVHNLGEIGASIDGGWGSVSVLKHYSAVTVATIKFTVGDSLADINTRIVYFTTKNVVGDTLGQLMASFFGIRLNEMEPLDIDAHHRFYALLNRKDSPLYGLGLPADIGQATVGEILDKLGVKFPQHYWYNARWGGPGGGTELRIRKSYAVNGPYVSFDLRYSSGGARGLACGSTDFADPSIAPDEALAEFFKFHVNSTFPAADTESEKFSSWLVDHGIPTSWRPLGETT